jgi:ABC-2 type transport system permease protein
VVPAGFSDAAVALDPASTASVQLLANADDALAAEVAAAIADGFLAQVNASRLSVRTAISAGAPVDRLGELAAAAAEDRLPIEISQRSAGSEPLDPISYYAPSMGMFFVLFAVGFASRSFFTERAQGTLERMAVAPVARRSILAGKALSVLGYAVASMTALALVTGILFGADWGHPLAAAVLIVAVGLAVVALTALVIAVSRTDRQADAVSSVVVFTLAILGGSFIQASELPPLMRTFALATPNGWALRGFVDLGTTTGGAGHDLRLVAGPTLGILAFTAVAGALATVASRRVAS